MDEILRHLRSTFLLVFTGESIFQGFLGGAKWVSSISARYMQPEMGSESLAGDFEKEAEARRGPRERKICPAREVRYVRNLDGASSFVFLCFVWGGGLEEAFLRDCFCWFWGPSISLMFPWPHMKSTEKNIDFKGCLCEHVCVWLFWDAPPLLLEKLRAFRRSASLDLAERRNSMTCSCSREGLGSLPSLWTLTLFGRTFFVANYKCGLVLAHQLRN